MSGVNATVSYSVSGGGSPTAPTFNYARGGTPGTYSATTTATTFQVDSGSAWSFTPNPLTGSTSHERWDSDAALSGTASADFTEAPAYYHQYNLTVRWALVPGDGGTPDSNPALTSQQFGASNSTALGLSYKTYWLDSGMAWSTPNPWFSDLTFFQPASGNGTGTVTTYKTLTVYYGSSPTCNGNSPFALFQQACYVPAVFFTFGSDSLLGPWFMGIVIPVLSGVLYLKTKNTGIALMIFILSGAALTGGTSQGLLPASLLPVGGVLLSFGLASAVYSAIRSRGQQPYMEEE